MIIISFYYIINLLWRFAIITRYKQWEHLTDLGLDTFYSCRDAVSGVCFATTPIHGQAKQIQ